MNEKNRGRYLRDSSRRWDNEILHSGAIFVKGKRDTDGIFLLYVVHYEYLILNHLVNQN